MTDTADNDAERKVAGLFLLVVVFMQAISGLTLAVQSSAGRGGRLMYYVAFGITVVHDLFTGIVVPGSLIWAAYELLARTRALDALLAAIVGTLWYGPDRVQAAIANLYRVRTRKRILVAALSEYHRAALYYGVDGFPLEVPLSVKRRLRFAPWWSKEERNAKKFWNGKVRIEGNPVEVVDEQLRMIARHGVAMALTGNYDEASLRYWCSGIVADQARFPCSLLENTAETHPQYARYVFEGLEGRHIKESLEEHGKQWSAKEWRQLRTIANGIRGQGLTYVRDAGWVQ